MSFGFGHLIVTNLSMWAVTIIIEAYEGFHSSRLNMELEELQESRELGKIMFLIGLEKRICNDEMVKYLNKLWYYHQDTAEYGQNRTRVPLLNVCTCVPERLSPALN